VGARLRRDVRTETGLAVSVGIAPVKMVAKIASDSAKPDGLREVRARELRAFLDPLPVGRLWGVGLVAEQRLLGLGLRTIGDLARLDAATARAWLGDWGVGMARLARGEDVRDVEPYRDAVSMSEENTFAMDVSDRAVLEAAILAHADSVARRLRKSGEQGRTIVLKLKLARRVAAGPRGYPLLTRRTTLPAPTDDGDAIASAARELLRSAGLAEPVRLLGVGVTNLEPANPEQLALGPEGAARARRASLNRALDSLDARFGRGAVHRAQQADVSRAALSDQIKRGE
jgi:DNA polymerase-4